MNDLKPMDIIVTRTKSPVSWLIRYKTGSPFSHVLVAGPDGTVFTTTVGGYSLKRADKYLKGKTYEVWRMDLTPEQVDKGISYSLQLVGTPYSYTDILRLLWSNLKGKGAMGVKGNSKNLYCAEAVCETYKAMNVYLAPQIHKRANQMLPHECIQDTRLTQVF